MEDNKTNFIGCRNTARDKAGTRTFKVRVLFCICLILVLLFMATYPVHAAGGYNISEGEVYLENSNETVSITGTSIEENTIIISGGNPVVQLNDVTIQAPNNNFTSNLENSETSKPAIYIKDGAQVTIEVNGTNELKGGAYRAGIQVEQGASVTIVGSGSLDVSTVGRQNTSAAGIGGGSVYNTENGENQGMPAGKIVIGGSVQITAACGWGSAAIGAASYVGDGEPGSASRGFESITLKEQAQVTTKEPGYSAAIGSGYQKSTDIYQYYENNVGVFTMQDDAKLILNGSGTDAGLTSFAKESIVATMNYLGGSIESVSETYNYTAVNPVKKKIQFIQDGSAFLKNAHITYKAAQRKDNENIQTLYNTITGEGTVANDGTLDITAFSGSDYVEAVTESGTVYRAVFEEDGQTAVFHQCTCVDPIVVRMSKGIEVPFMHNGSYEFDTCKGFIELLKEENCPLEEYLHIAGQQKITSPDITITEKGKEGSYHIVIPEASMNKTINIAVSLMVNGQEKQQDFPLTIVKKEMPQIESLTIDKKGELQSEEAFTITLTATHMEVFQRGLLSVYMMDSEGNELSRPSFKRLKDNQWQADLKAPANRTGQIQTYRLAVIADTEYDGSYAYDFNANAFVERKDSADIMSYALPVSVNPDQTIPSFSFSEGALKISRDANGAVQVLQIGKEPVILPQKKLAVSKAATLEEWKSLYGEEDYKTQPLVEIEDGVEVEIDVDGQALREPGSEDYTANLIEGKDQVILKLDSTIASLIKGNIYLGNNSTFKAGEVVVYGNVTASRVEVEKAGTFILLGTLTAGEFKADQAKIAALSLNVQDSVTINDSLACFEKISVSEPPILNDSVFGFGSGYDGVFKNSLNQTLKATELNITKLMSYGDYPFPVLKDITFSTNHGKNWHTIDFDTKTIQIFGESTLWPLAYWDTAVLYVPDDTADVLIKLADKIYKYELTSEDYTDEVMLYLDKDELISKGTAPQAELSLENRGTVDISYIHCQLTGKDADKMQILDKSGSGQRMNIKAGSRHNIVAGLKEGTEVGTYEANLVVSIGDLQLYSIPVTLTKQEKDGQDTESSGGADNQPDQDSAGNQTAANIKTGSVKSGDESSAGLYVVLLIGAVIVIGGRYYGSKKKKEDVQGEN